MKKISVAALANKTKTSMANINSIIGDTLGPTQKMVIIPESDINDFIAGEISSMDDDDLNDISCRIAEEIARRNENKVNRIKKDLYKSIDELKGLGVKHIGIRNSKVFI